jgi:DNA-binding transcriptional LysR family regulator
MQWDSLRYVRAVCVTGSVTGAAGKLGVDAVTVARHIKAIEKQLGVRLFDRTRKGYVPTPSAAEIARQAERMEDEVGALERRIWQRDKELHGVVRLTTPDTTGAFVVAPLMQTLHRLHPDVTVELNVDNRVLNISKRDADIAIRTTDRPPENLIGHRVAVVAYAPYAAARLLPRGRSRRANLSHLPWVSLDSSFRGGRVDLYQRYIGSHGGRVILRVNSAIGMALAVKSGAGLGVLSCMSASRLGGLVRIGPCIDELRAELWILTHPELRDVARVAMVYAFLRQEIRKLQPVFLGKEERAPG